MTAASLAEPAPAPRLSPVLLVSIGFAALALLCAKLPAGTIPRWMLEIPPGWRLGLNPAITRFMNWLIDDATFGLPEVDRGALGAATHLARLVPQHRMRAAVYTAQPIPAAELLQYGSILKVVDKEQLRGVAREVAQQIASKSPTAIRAAKQSLNGIDPVDVKRSYRYEQGFTYELTLAGVGGEARAHFAEKKTGPLSK